MDRFWHRSPRLDRVPSAWFAPTVRLTTTRGAGDGGLRRVADKAKDFVDEHEEQVDRGIDKAADAAGERFGHEEQIDKLSERLQGMTGDGESSGES
jgi:hypothetical protein